jgi:hypothetical protein
MKKIIVLACATVLSVSAGVYAAGEAPGSLFLTEGIAVGAGLGPVCAGSSSGLEGLAFNPAFRAADPVIALSAGFHPLGMNEQSGGVTGLVKGLGRGLSWAAQARYFSSGSMDRLDENGLDDGSFSLSDLAVSAGASYEIVEGLNAGIRGHFLMEKALSSANGFAADAGISYSFDLSGTGFSIGASGANLLGSLYGMTLSPSVTGGILVARNLAPQALLEGGAAVGWNRGADLEYGPGVRFSYTFEGDRPYVARAGLNYMFDGQTGPKTWLTGLTAGAEVKTPFAVTAGYRFTSNPWGGIHAVMISYTLASGSQPATSQTKEKKERKQDAGRDTGSDEDEGNLDRIFE